MRKDIWAKIWKLDTTHAVRRMLWRACHEFLPTNQNLFKRKIVESPLCPVCGLGPESASHILWLCKSAQDVWGFSFKRLQKVVVMESSFKDLMSHLFTILDEEEMAIFAVTVYQLWQKRNSLVFEGKFMDPNALLQVVNQQSMDFKAANQKVDEGIVVESHIESQWRAPPLHVFKANWDAIVDKVNCKVGVGVIVRDWTGKVIASLRSQRAFFLDAYLAEAFAALKAVILDKQLGLQRILLEGDAQKVVNDIKGAADQWSSAGLMVSNIRLLLQHFQHWSVSFVPRKFNYVAHCLAKDALKLSEESIVLEGVPPCIRYLLQTA